MVPVIHDTVKTRQIDAGKPDARNQSAHISGEQSGTRQCLVSGVENGCNGLLCVLEGICGSAQASAQKTAIRCHNGRTALATAAVYAQEKAKFEERLPAARKFILDNAINEIN